MSHLQDSLTPMIHIAPAPPTQAQDPKPSFFFAEPILHHTLGPRFALFAHTVLLATWHITLPIRAHQTTIELYHSYLNRTYLLRRASHARRPIIAPSSHVCTVSYIRLWTRKQSTSILQSQWHASTAQPPPTTAWTAASAHDV
jgi:hypothetical protein